MRSQYTTAPGACPVHSMPLDRLSASAASLSVAFDLYPVAHGLLQSDASSVPMASPVPMQS